MNEVVDGKVEKKKLTRIERRSSGNADAAAFCFEGKSGIVDLVNIMDLTLFLSLPPLKER